MVIKEPSPWKKVRLDGMFCAFLCAALLACPALVGAQAVKIRPLEIVPTSPDKLPFQWMIREATKNSSGAFVVAFSPDGRYLAARDRENEIYIYDLEKRTKLAPFKGHDSNWVESIHFSQDSKYFVSTAGSGEKLKVWKTESGALQLEIVTTAHSARFSPNGEEVIVLGSQNIEVYSFPQGKLLRRTNWQMNKDEALAMSDDGGLVVTCRVGNGIAHQTELFNLVSKSRYELPGEISKPRRVVISNDNRWVAACFENGNRLHLWNAEDPKQLGYVLDNYGGEIVSLAFSHDSRFIVSVDDKQSLVAWDLLTRQPIVEFGTEQNPVRTVACSQGGYQFAAGGATNGNVSIWVGDLKPKLLPKGQPLPDSLDVIWRQLGSASVDTSLAGVGLLVENFEQYREILRSTVYDATFENSIEDLPILLEQLADSRFQQRELAMQQLTNRLSDFESSLRELLGTDLPIETRYRINTVLKQKARRPKFKVEILRRWHRLVFVLESVNSPESRQILQRIASGHPDQEISETATSALERLSLLGSCEPR